MFRTYTLAPGLIKLAPSPRLYNRDLYQIDPQPWLCPKGCESDPTPVAARGEHRLDVRWRPSAFPVELREAHIRQRRGRRRVQAEVRMIEDIGGDPNLFLVLAILIVAYIVSHIETW